MTAAKKLYKVITCRVDEEPKVEHVQNPFTFTAKTLLDGGLVEVVYLDDGVQVYCDEDARFKNLKYNRDLPATSPHMEEAGFIIEMREEDDPPFALPGQLGYHKIYGNFLLTRHDRKRDKPLDLTDEDVRKYIAMLNAH